MRRVLRWALLVVVLLAGCAEPDNSYIVSYAGGHRAGQRAASEGSRAERTKQQARRELHEALRRMFNEPAFEEGYADGLAGRPPRLQVSDLH